jgi:hypothetical protein
MRLKICETQLAYIGMSTIGLDYSKFSIAAVDQIFISHYGSCVTMCTMIWDKVILSGECLPSQKPDHLFWALLYMKVYSTQRVMCTMVKTTRPTFNKHVHHIIYIMSKFPMVSESLFIAASNTNLVQIKLVDQHIYS